MELTTAELGALRLHLPFEEEFESAYGSGSGDLAVHNFDSGTQEILNDPGDKDHISEGLSN